MKHMLAGETLWTLNIKLPIAANQQWTWHQNWLKQGEQKRKTNGPSCLAWLTTQSCASPRSSSGSFQARWKINWHALEFSIPHGKKYTLKRGRCQISNFLVPFQRVLFDKSNNNIKTILESTKKSIVRCYGSSCIKQTQTFLFFFLSVSKYHSNLKWGCDAQTFLTNQKHSNILPPVEHCFDGVDLRLVNKPNILKERILMQSRTNSFETSFEPYRNSNR